VVGVVLAAAGGRAQAAQEDLFSGPVPTGRVIEDVPSSGDPSQTFSLYLPRAYSPERTWPIVLLLDPRGRSEVPMRRLVPAAERLGYVLASSNNTASDVDGEPNTPAVNAMLATLQPHLALDDRLIYLFGMSGTARISWAIAYAAIPHVAGIAGFAAGPPPDMSLEDAQGRHGVPFVFYGGAGDRDFNHAELVLLESRLRRLGFRYAASYYPGPHGWPEEPEFSAALSWLHLMAMQRGLLDVDPAWVNAEYAVRLEAARALEQAGDESLAWMAYSGLVTDFADLVDTSEASRRAERLAAEASVSEWRARRLELARAHAAYSARTGLWFRDAQTSNPDLASSLEALAVDSLKALAGNAADPQGAAAAWRALADLYSLTSFYYVRFYVDRDDWPRARVTLEIADSIVPGNPGVCRKLEQVLTKLGREKGSGSSLGCAALVNSGPDS
jgi:predicted esterase